MAELAELVFQRGTFIALAIGGAVMVTLAAVLKGRLGEARFRLLNRAGYALTLLSVLVFIGAGYLSN